MKRLLTRFSVENFKQLKSINIKLQPLSIIIGPNGAGKSTFLQSIDFLKAFVSTSIDFYLEKKMIDLNELFHKSNQDKKVIVRKKINWDVEIILEENIYEYQVSLTNTKQLSEKLTMNGKELFSRHAQNYKVFEGDYEEGKFLNPNSGFLASITEEQKEKYPHLYTFKKYIEHIRTFLIWDPTVLRSRSRGLREGLGDNGQELAGVLHDMKSKHPNQFIQMLQRLRTILPTLQDISVKTSSNGWKEIILSEYQGNGNVAFSRNQISDGTLRLFAIATLRYGMDHYSLLSFEEPENGIHPPVLKKAVSMVHELTQMKQPFKSQVIMTTHNAELLELFQDSPEVILVMEKKAKEGTVIFPIPPNAQKVAKALFNNSLGDLWLSNYLFDEEVMER